MVKKVDVNGLINCFKQAVDHNDVLEKSLRWQKLYKPTDSFGEIKKEKKNCIIMSDSECSEYEWDNIDVDYPPHLLLEIEEFERKYFAREERVNIYYIFSQ